MSLLSKINTGLDWLQGGGIQKAAQTANTLMQNAPASNTTNQNNWINTSDGRMYNTQTGDFKKGRPRPDSTTLAAQEKAQNFDVSQSPYHATLDTYRVGSGDLSGAGYDDWYKGLPKELHNDIASAVASGSPLGYNEIEKMNPWYIKTTEPTQPVVPTEPTGLLPTEPTPTGPDPVGPTQPVAPPPPAAPQPQGNSDLIDIFQPDKYPSSWSGLPPETRDNLLDKILPRLFESVDNYEGNIDKSTKAAQELFQSQTRGGMKDTLQGILNSLAGRNMLNSTVASESIGQGMSDIIRAGADKGYETSMNNAGLKAQLPALLANITQLGQGSFNSNPLAPYELLAQYDWNMD